VKKKLEIVGGINILLNPAWKPSFETGFPRDIFTGPVGRLESVVHVPFMVINLILLLIC